MFEFKKCSEFLRKKTKKEKEMKNQKKIEKWKNHKKKPQKKNPAAAVLTGRPSIAPTRAEQGSVPLTRGA
jgi:hypothetical protein